jgi:hypothetical protein
MMLAAQQKCQQPCKMQLVVPVEYSLELRVKGANGNRQVSCYVFIYIYIYILYIFTSCLHDLMRLQRTSRLAFMMPGMQLLGFLRLCDLLVPYGHFEGIDYRLTDVAEASAKARNQMFVQVGLIPHGRA